ncbi:MAG: hypothetical protein II969_15570 [Anaerolineaceae bacterium]|nr:hypothetical protein [Anaerolineaceae bacterium]
MARNKEKRIKLSVITGSWIFNIIFRKIKKKIKKDPTAIAIDGRLVLPKILLVHRFRGDTENKYIISVEIAEEIMHLMKV